MGKASANARPKAGQDRTLDDDVEPVDELGPNPEAPAPAVTEAELAVDDRLLAGAGMAGIDYTRRRFGMAGAGFVSTAAGVAEDARGGEPGDLLILSVPAGELGRAMELLEELGVRRPG